jgi:hypothetical protein
MAAEGVMNLLLRFHVNDREYQQGDRDRSREGVEDGEYRASLR